MFFLKNITKTYLLFFILFSTLLLWPNQKALGLCNNAPCPPDPDFPCGDGYKLTTEECDDGDLDVFDGCDDMCKIENGWYCRLSAYHSYCYRNCGNTSPNAGEICDWGEVGRPGVTPINGGNNNTTWCSSLPYANPPETCTYCQTNCQFSETIEGSHCGDDKKDAGYETCDDGNTTSEDGCSSTCQIETGWDCTKIDGQHSTCNVVCGNAIITPPEICDQGYGNVANGDGCNSSCQKEHGWYCQPRTYPPYCALTDTLCLDNMGHSVCNTVCGDGLKANTEACDDANNIDGDGCSNGCATIDNGYYCPGEGTNSCYATCGDGKIAIGTETCEDTPPNNDIEECPYNLTAAGSACTICNDECHSVQGKIHYCGDHKVDPTEECDYDSQPVSGPPLATPHNDDGCNINCQEEDGWDCFDNPLGQNVCIFHCGNGTKESTAFYTEECDYAAAGTGILSTDPVVGRGLFNGDKCASTGYNQSCSWCTMDCRITNESGPFCGDSFKNGTEECDDGNYDANDGCNNCKITPGWKCSPNSACTPICGNSICTTVATNPDKRESCASCSADCGICVVQRPGVAVYHPANPNVNFLEKLKSTFIRPKLLVNIPGLNLKETEKSKFELPPPNDTWYQPLVPTTITIGDRTLTITVFPPDPGAPQTVTFSIR